MERVRVKDQCRHQLWRTTFTPHHDPDNIIEYQLHEHQISVVNLQAIRYHKHLGAWCLLKERLILLLLC